ncbi:MAG: radical SAM protein [Lachnospiraceae bacterium]|nr:radical SAM protein [Lachnospiraceae bacterium]
MSTRSVRKTDRDRKRLRDLVPLISPFGISIECVSACNFRCRFCPHGHKDFNEDMYFENGFINFDLFKKIIDDVKEFPYKPGVLNLSYRGEPLLHPQIAEIIKYAEDANVVDNVEIFTNASLLTPELSDKLIDAGLDIINISIEGLSNKAYLDVTGVEVDFEKIVENVRYFYQHKKKTEVYVKIISQLCKDEEIEQFKDIFSEICDYYDFEDIVDCWQNDIDDELYNSEKLKMNNRYAGLTQYRRKVCPEPFYKFVILYNGLAVSCVEDYKSEFVMGDLNYESALDVWNGEKFNKFRYAQCTSNLDGYHICQRDCYKYKDIRHLDEDPDNIDDLPESVIEKFKK